MEAYNFFYNGQSIPKSQFLKAVPENWESEVEDGEYSWGYYRALEIENEIKAIAEEQEANKIFRLMNHDSSHQAPKFEAYTLESYNEQFGTSYASIEEAVDSDPEYLFTESKCRNF